MCHFILYILIHMKMKYCLIILILTLIANEVKGVTYFNYKTETCCEGVVYPNPRQSCCGNVTFTIGVQQCCRDGKGGSVLVPDRKNQTDPFYLCCRGVVHSLPNLEDYDCCDSSYYNKNEKICCFTGFNNDRRMLPRLPGRESDDSCCGESTYSSTQGLTCCAGAIVNDQTQICCNQEKPAIPKPKPSAACCGEILYDSSTELCNGEDIFPISQEELSRQFTKCGNEKLRDVALNPGNPTRDLCCNDKLNVVPENSKIFCCGKELYDRAFQECCEYNEQTKVINKAENLDIQCCGSDLIPYNKAMAQCCKDKVEGRDPVLENDPNMRMCCI